MIRLSHDANTHKEVSTMQRQVIFDQDDTEGYCFDVDRANREGLVEEMSVTFDGKEVEISSEQFEAILTATDLSVNIPPGEEQEIELVVKYRYDYGHVSTPV